MESPSSPRNGRPFATKFQGGGVCDSRAVWQAIRDLAVEKMVNGRAILLGDASAIPRPHTAYSAAKAAENALTLYDELKRHSDNLAQALANGKPRKWISASS